MKEPREPTPPLRSRLAERMLARVAATRQRRERAGDLPFGPVVIPRNAVAARIAAGCEGALEGCCNPASQPYPNA